MTRRKARRIALHEAAVLFAQHNVSPEKLLRWSDWFVDYLLTGKVEEDEPRKVAV